MAMAKASGLGQTALSIDNSSGSVQALVNSFTNWQFATPRGVQDVTGVDKSAMERILLLADFSMTVNGPWDSASSPNPHDVFKDIPTTSVSRTVTITHLSKTMTAECLLTDYPLTRATSGELTWAVPGVLCNGVAPTWS
jgi:hypothetical protein